MYQLRDKVSQRIYIHSSNRVVHLVEVVVGKASQLGGHVHPAMHNAGVSQPELEEPHKHTADQRRDQILQTIIRHPQNMIDR